MPPLHETPALIASSSASPVDAAPQKHEPNGMRASIASARMDAPGNATDGYPVARPQWHTFSVLGTRFAWQPDAMRLVKLHPRQHADALPLDDIRRPNLPLGPSPVRRVVLLLTDACTLRCRYCFHADHAPRTMSPHTARHALSLLPANRDLHISFFGGEPLLAMETMHAAIDAAYEIAGTHGTQPRFHLTTNGTELDDTTAAFLDDHRFSVILSLDGPPRLHNAARPRPDGSGSHTDAMHALAALARHPRLIRRTTLRATYDGAGNGVHLVERLIHLNALARQFGCGGVSVEPADLSEGCAGGASPVEASEALFEEYMDAAEWYAGQVAAGVRPMFHHVDVRMRRLRERRASLSECGAGVGYLAVDPGGVLHACHRLSCPVGTLGDGIDYAAQAPWRENRYYARTTCPTCVWRNVCGGGCRWVSHVQGGDIRKPSRLGCFLTDTCTRAAAWLLTQDGVMRASR